MKKIINCRKTIAVALIAATALLGIGTAPKAGAQVYYEAPTAPPPPPGYYSVPAPRVGYEWVPGYWSWRRGRYVWVSGRWVGARVGHHWIPAHWVASPRGWRFIPGYWD